MKLIEDNSGMLPGETCHIPVCRECGCMELFKTRGNVLYRVKRCPKCGHIIDWKGGSDGK